MEPTLTIHALSYTCITKQIKTFLTFSRGNVGTALHAFNSAGVWWQRSDKIKSALASADGDELRRLVALAQP